MACHKKNKQVYTLVNARKAHKQEIPSLLFSIPSTHVLAQIVHLCKEAAGS